MAARLIALTRESANHARMQGMEDPGSAWEVNLGIVTGVWKASLVVFDLSALIRYIHVSSIVNAKRFQSTCSQHGSLTRPVSKP